MVAGKTNGVNKFGQASSLFVVELVAVFALLVYP